MIRYGQFSSKKDRELYGRELRKAHFQLGSEQKPTSTTYKRDYLSYGTEGTAQRKVDGGMLRASHFALGRDGLNAASSYSHDYARKAAERTALNSSTISDLRATHYSLGHSSLDYCSINRQDYAPPKPEPKCTLGQKLESGTMSKHNVRLGDAPIAYQSCNSAAYGQLAKHEKHARPP